MSYRILNCPATYQNFEDKFVCTTQIKEKGFPFYCQDCTDCLLKKIVEKCREDWEDSTVLKFQRELLDLLAIEECE